MGACRGDRVLSKWFVSLVITHRFTNHLLSTMPLKWSFLGHLSTWIT